eukprot:261546_1
MRPATEFITINGLQHHIAHWNRDNYDPNKGILLLLHGFNQTYHSWEEFALKIASLGYWCIAPDKRGMGESERASSYKGYQRNILVDDVYKIITHYVNNTKQKITVIGMSMSAVHSIVLAVTYPQIVDKLVIIDNAPKVKRSGQTNIQSVVGKRWNTFDNAVKDIVKFNKYRTRKNIIKRLKYSLEFDLYDDNKWSWKFDLQYFITMKSAMNESPDIMWNYMKQVKCPTLMVYGENSDLISDEIAQKVVSCLQNGQLVKIYNAGHSVVGDNLNEFYRKVVPFIENKYAIQSKI